MLQDSPTAVVAHIIQLAVALLFITAMVAFITALLFLLREISLALAGLRFGRRAAATASPPGEDVRR